MIDIISFTVVIHDEDHLYSKISVEGNQNIYISLTEIRNPRPALVFMFIGFWPPAKFSR